MKIHKFTELQGKWEEKYLSNPLTIFDRSARICSSVQRFSKARNRAQLFRNRPLKFSLLFISYFRVLRARRSIPPPPHPSSSYRLCVN